MKILARICANASRLRDEMRYTATVIVGISAQHAMQTQVDELFARGESATFICTRHSGGRVHTLLEDEGYVQVDSRTTEMTEIKVLCKNSKTVNIASHDNNALAALLHGPTAMATTFISADSVICVYPELLCRNVDLPNRNRDVRIPNDFLVSAEKVRSSCCSELALRCGMSPWCPDVLRSGGDRYTMHWRFDETVYDDTEYSRTREKRRIGMDVVWRLGRRCRNGCVNIPEVRGTVKVHEGLVPLAFPLRLEDRFQWDRGEDDDEAMEAMKQSHYL